MRRSLVLLALFVPMTAVAVPMELSHQGRLMDANGVPLDGTHTLDFAIYDDPSAGASTWTQNLSVEFADGYFSVTLTGVDDAVFNGDARYLALAVDGAPELVDRQSIVSVPYAIRAYTATNVVGGIVDVSEIRINGTSVIDSSGALDPDRLPAHDHDASEVASGVFDPARLPGHDHDASEVATGVLSADRLPIGGGSSDVAAGDHQHSISSLSGVVALSQLPVGTSATDLAAGNHTHGFGDLTGAAVVGQLPVGTSASNVAAGNHGHSAADVGAVPASGGDVSGRLNVAEEIQVGQGSGTCDNTNDEGTIRWTGTELQVCTDSGWSVVFAASQGGGIGQDDPGISCDQLHQEFPALGSGSYWIDPNGGSTADAFQVVCDMTTDGGGWISLQISSAGADRVYRTNADNSNNGVIRSGDQAQYYNQISTVDGFTEVEYLHNALVAGRNLDTQQVTYRNPATGSNFTAGQLNQIRGVVTELAPSIHSVAVAVDDSGMPGGLGHEIYLSDGGGGNYLNVTYGTQPSDEQSCYILLHTDPNLTSDINVDLSLGGVRISQLPSEYLLPASVRLGWDNSVTTEWGGAAYWGYSEDTFLVK